MNLITHVLLFLSLCWNNVASLDDIQRFIRTGNEKQIANHYLQLMNTSFDEKFYFHQATHCFTKALNGLRTCLSTQHQLLFEGIRLWTVMLPDRDPKDRSIDCKYDMTSKHLKLLHDQENNVTIYNYHFLITQGKCESEWKVKGGASFLINAYDDGHLVSCRTKDTLDNDYHVICSIMRRTTEIKHDSNPADFSCVNISVLLEYEHFDSFCEALTGESFANLKRYYNLRYNLINNRKFCFINTDGKQGNAIDEWDMIDVLDGSSQKGFRQLIFGKWLSQQNCRDNYDGHCFLYLNSSVLSAYEHHRERNELSSIAKGNEINNRKFSEIIASPQYGKSFSEKYVFRPIIQLFHNDKRPLSRPPLPTIRFDPYNSKKMIHFVGSSHIRNVFDAITEYYGLGYFPKDVTIAHNMKNHHTINSYSSLFADDQSFHLQDLCNSFSKSNNVKQTIIFQTGVWDLTFTPIRRMLHDPTTAHRLISTIIQILQGKHYCPNLEQFIFLTETPNSPCLNEDDVTCRDTQGYRTNGAIAALNQYYLSPLLNTTVKDGLLFTIIDAYSIMLPRIQLLPDMEYDCSFHYHCKSYTNTHESQSKLTLGHTPAGAAMTRAVLLALSTLP